MKEGDSRTRRSKRQRKDFFLEAPSSFDKKKLSKEEEGKEGEQISRKLFFLILLPLLSRAVAPSSIKFLPPPPPSSSPVSSALLISPTIRHPFTSASLHEACEEKLLCKGTPSERERKKVVQQTCKTPCCLSLSLSSISGTCFGWVGGGLAVCLTVATLVGRVCYDDDTGRGGGGGKKHPNQERFH